MNKAEWEKMSLATAMSPNLYMCDEYKFHSVVALSQMMIIFVLKF